MGRDAIDKHFQKWLRVGTGCRFAASLAQGGRVVYESHEAMPVVPELDARLEVYAERAFTAILIFPFVSGEAELLDVLVALRDGSSRWRLCARGPGMNGTALVGVEWSTAAANVSDAMGFAPLPTMPVPRRAPYFALALWPGGRANPERGTPPTPRAPPGQVSFLDASHSYKHDDYVAMWTRTEAAVSDLMAMPSDDAKLYRKVAFALSATAGMVLREALSEAAKPDGPGTRSDPT